MLYRCNIDCRRLTVRVAVALNAPCMQVPRTLRAQTRVLFAERQALLMKGYEATRRNMAILYLRSERSDLNLRICQVGGWVGRPYLEDGQAKHFLEVVDLDQPHLRHDPNPSPTSQCIFGGVFQKARRAAERPTSTNQIRPTAGSEKISCPSCVEVESCRFFPLMRLAFFSPRVPSFFFFCCMIDCIVFRWVRGRVCYSFDCPFFPLPAALGMPAYLLSIQY